LSRSESRNPVLSYSMCDGVFEMANWRSNRALHWEDEAKMETRKSNRRSIDTELVKRRISRLRAVTMARV
jgi:hypothetical protein